MNRIITGVTLILAGVLIALAPQYVFPVCAKLVPTASGGAVPMKCFWTARAELGTGALIAFGGLLLCVIRDARARAGIAAMTAAASLLAVALPAVLIGVCGNETMPCRMGTQPALFLLGGAAFLISAASCRRSVRSVEKAGRG